jgi:hypothetical protein
MNLWRTDCEDGDCNSVASEDPTDVYGARTCVPRDGPQIYPLKNNNGPRTRCGILVHKHALMSAALMYYGNPQPPLTLLTN